MAFSARKRAKERKRALAHEAKRPESRAVSNLQEMRRENLKKAWHRFSRNKMSVVGLSIVILVILAAIFAPYIAPYPEHAGAFTDFAKTKG